MNFALTILIFQKLLLLLTFVSYLFWTWWLGRLWGFQKEKIIDLALITPAAGLVVYSLFRRLGLSSESFFLLGGVAFVFYFTEKQIWSRLKIGDIFALSLSFASIFYPYYPSPVFNLMSLALFYLLFKVYKAKPRSGFVFFTFLMIASIYLLTFSFWWYHRFWTLNSAFALFCLFLAVLSVKKKEYHEAMDLLKYSLSGDILETLKKRLLEKKKNLEGEATNLVGEGKSLNSPLEKSAEEQDQATAQQAKERNETVLDSIGQSQKDVDTALKKMGRGNYGLCEKCGKPIDKARLEIYPESRYCLDHAEAE